MLLKIKVNAVHAGHSLPLPPSKEDMPSRRALRLCFLSSKWSIALLLATVATEVGPQELFSMSKVLVDKCHLPHILTEVLRVVADSALDLFRQEFLGYLESLMQRVLSLQAQLPFIFRPLANYSSMEAVYSTVPAVSTTTLLPLSAGVSLEALNTGSSETHGALDGVNPATSELLSMENA